MAIENSTRFILQTIGADANRGGWQANGSFASDQDEAVYGRRVDIYATAEGDGAWEADAILAMRGSIIPQSVSFDIRQSATPVTLSTTDNFLRNAGLQGIYFTETNPPTHPHQYADLRLGTIVRHIIEQHTNISSTAFIQNTDGTFSATKVGGWVDTSDIDTTLSTSVDVYTVRQSNSIWSTLKKIASNEFYVVYMTKRDEFVYRQHPVFDVVLPDVVVDIDADMIVGLPEIIFRDRVQVDQVKLAALTDTGEILRSNNPATIGTDGRAKSFTNLRCNSQVRLDQLAERAFDFESRTYDLRIPLAGPWGLYLELYDRVTFTYTGTARNGVSLSFTAEPFFIEGIRVTRNASFGAVTELRMTQENVTGGLYG